MQLKPYLKSIGLKGTKELAKEVGVHYLYLYHIASGWKRPSPLLALKIEKATDGKVTLEDIYGKERANELRKIWGNDGQG